MKHLSKEEIEQLFKTGLSNYKSVFFTPIELERIFKSVIDSESLESINLKLTEFETYLQALEIKLLKPPITNVKKEQLDRLEAMKSTLELIYQINFVNETQKKIISDLRLKLFKSEKENYKLKKIINNG